MYNIGSAIVALVVFALSSVNVHAQPSELCVEANTHSKNISTRFRIKSGHDQYARSGDESTKSQSGYDYLGLNGWACYDAKKLLNNRRNVDYHIQVKGAADCRTYRVDPGGPSWSGTKDFVVKHILWGPAAECKEK